MSYIINYLVYVGFNVFFITYQFIKSGQNLLARKEMNLYCAADNKY